MLISEISILFNTFYYPSALTAVVVLSLAASVRPFVRPLSSTPPDSGPQTFVRGPANCSRALRFCSFRGPATCSQAPHFFSRFALSKQFFRVSSNLLSPRSAFANPRRGFLNQIAVAFRHPSTATDFLQLARRLG